MRMLAAAYHFLRYWQSPTFSSGETAICKSQSRWLFIITRYKFANRSPAIDKARVLKMHGHAIATKARSFRALYLIARIRHSVNWFLLYWNSDDIASAWPSWPLLRSVVYILAHTDDNPHSSVIACLRQLCIREAELKINLCEMSHI